MNLESDITFSLPFSPSALKMSQSIKPGYFKLIGLFVLIDSKTWSSRANSIDVTE